MENQKNNKGAIALLIVIIAILLVLCVLFATGTISFNSNSTNSNQQTNENSQTNTSNNTNEESSTIQSKLVGNLNCNSSETTFNGITVKVEQKYEDMVCVTSTFTINGVDVTKDNGHNIESYEFFDKNVIIMSSTTSGPIFTIYSVNSNSTILKFNTLDNLEGYFIKSYSTNNNIITLNAEGCGAQCGEKGIENAGVKATFEIEYSNGSFSQPKLISKTN